MPILGGVGKDTVIEAGKQAGQLEQQAAADVQKTITQTLEAAKETLGIVNGMVTKITAAVEGVEADIKQLILTVDASMMVLQTVVARLDGAKIQLTLGPEPGK